MKTPGTDRHRQRGAAAVEFAMTVLIFLALVIGVIEFSRVMFHWSTAIEATRLGARVAVVCDPGSDAVRKRMRQMLPLLKDENIRVNYPITGCSTTTCPPVTVSLTGFTVSTIIPLAAVSFMLPDLSTSISTESLDSFDNYLCN